METGHWRTLLLWLLVHLFVCPCALGQDDTEKPQIKSLQIRSDIKFRFATTLISSAVVNPANFSTETKFEVTLPDEAFISDFKMEIDGVVYQANIDEKQKALDTYNKAKKRGQSAGHVSKNPRDTNKFKVAVNIAALSYVTFNLTYQEVLTRKLGIYRHRIYVSPGQPVDHLRIDVAIQESRGITLLRVPPIRNDLLTENDPNESNDIAVVSQPTATSAFISYFPDVIQQLEESPDGIVGQFVVEYDIARDLDAGDILASNGYFVHFFAPEVKQAIPKDILFVLDTSGSMSDDKIRQLKDAMLSILGDLTESDRFNIVEFNSKTSTFKSGMVKVTKNTIEEAKAYITGLNANGWTNINSALLEALADQKAVSQEGLRSPVVVFLTDGEPSSGVQNTETILSNVRKANEGNIPIFSLAFGEGADWGFVKKVALQNDGVAKRIYADSDASLQISEFYDQLAATLLKNVSVSYLDEGINKDSLTTSTFNNFYRGSEMVVAGRMEDTSANTVDLRILGNSLEGEIVLSSPQTPDIRPDVPNLTNNSDFEKIIEKTWAYLTIKELLAKASAETNSTVKEDINQQALQLSLKYSFVTPLTSLVVTKPEEEVPVQPRATSTQAPTTTTPKPSYNRGSSRRRGGGGGGGGGGGSSGGGGGDPHYMIRERGIEHPICFDLLCHDGEIYRLLKDPVYGITINAAIIESPKLNIYGQHKTFIGQVAVILHHHRILITPNEIFYDDRELSWKTEVDKHFGENKMMVKDRGHELSIKFHFGPEVIIRRHIAPENSTDSVDYLNVYINKEDGFGRKSQGLLGRFVNSYVKLQLRKTHTQPGGKLMAKFALTDRSQKSNDASHRLLVRHVIRGNLVDRNEVVGKGTELCWMVHHSFDEFLYGNGVDILLPDIFQI